MQLPCQWSNWLNPVLIETLWNVNDVTERFYDYLKTVLIETLWNVNDYRKEKIQGLGAVLIETLWNVNTISPCPLLITSGINRNIVECK